MGATRRNFRARPKFLKKKSEDQNNQSKRRIFQKKYVLFSTLNVYRSQKFLWGLPDKIGPGSLKNNWPREPEKQ
jgi:hypothetical protein